jgi:hypothetical protein
MIALPVAFLPFDPNRDYEVDESCSESDDDDDESNEDHLHDSISNGDNNHKRKQNRHIGGGVLLVNEIFYCIKSIVFYFVQ